MTQKERTYLLERLSASEAHLRELVGGLTAEQWAFREHPERWSIAQNVEHLILFERFIRGVVVKIAAMPAEPEKADAVVAKHEAVLALDVVGNMKIQAREVVRPLGRLADRVELQETLWRERAQTVEYARESDADLRQHIFAHLTLGDLDAYQWLLVIAQHTDRHAAQIQRVMSDPGFQTTA